MPGCLAVDEYLSRGINTYDPDPGRVIARTTVEGYRVQVYRVGIRVQVDGAWMPFDSVESFLCYVDSR